MAMRTKALVGVAVLLTTLLAVETLLPGRVLKAAVTSTSDENPDRAVVEAVIRGNPSEHFAEDGSFTNIFGTVRYGREEFRQRHLEIAQSMFKGTSVKSSIGKLRFVRPDVVIADITGEMSGFEKVTPGLPVGADGILKFQLLEVLVKDKGEWSITEYHNVAVTPELK